MNIHNSHQKERDIQQKKCAFCKSPINHDNDSKEHIIPNAIGGRKTVRNFICIKCNNTTGQEWDRYLVDQLQPLCTMLNIKRQKGKNKKVKLETKKGKEYLLGPDGSIKMTKPIVNTSNVGDNKIYNIQAGRCRDLNKIVSDLMKKFPNSYTDKKEIMKKAVPVREYLKDYFKIRITLGGDLAGRSIIKSCLALAYDSGLDINDLEHAREYLLLNGKPCFGYYNETDVMLNRPPNIFPHCVFICGNPITKQILGYVEYFGYQGIVAGLSSSYSGKQFYHSYAIDPITGKVLNIDIRLDLTSEDIIAIYNYEKVNYNNTQKALKSLMNFYMNNIIQNAIDHEVNEAYEFAIANCGAQPGELPSEQHIQNIINLFMERIEPFIIHILSIDEFNPDAH